MGATFKFHSTATCTQCTCHMCFTHVNPRRHPGKRPQAYTFITGICDGNHGMTESPVGSPTVPEHRFIYHFLTMVLKGEAREGVIHTLVPIVTMHTPNGHGIYAIFPQPNFCLIPPPQPQINPPTRLNFSQPAPSPPHTLLLRTQVRRPARFRWMPARARSARQPRALIAGLCAGGHSVKRIWCNFVCACRVQIAGSFILIGFTPQICAGCLFLPLKD
jgi:hypothetical protein